MAARHFPTRPHDEVESAFVRTAIRRGDFDDLEHREHVTDLVVLERFGTRGATEFTDSTYYRPHRDRFATEFDALWGELGDARKPGERPATRTWSISRTIDGEIDGRQCRSRVHRPQWGAVVSGTDGA